jgi:4-amino-4-deoxy-L-arabinose transferase-like glycosyltransferase
MGPFPFEEPVSMSNWARSRTVGSRRLQPAEGVKANDSGQVRVEVAVLVAVTLACLLPFVARPLHIDDPLFVWCARHIAAHPLDFYGFKVNWGRTPEPMYVVTQNPPLTCYWLALAGRVFGWSEVALHLAMLPWAVTAVVGTYALARCLCRRPVWAALAAMSMPVFLISATSLMCDVMMTSLWTWSILFWVLGHRRQRANLLFAAALLASLALLTKYFAVALVPLLLAYAVFSRRMLGWSALALVLPVVTLLGFDVVCRSLYGHSPLIGLRAFVSTSSEPRGLVKWVVYPGGCVLTVGVLLPLLGRRILAGSLAAGVLVGVISQSVQAGVFSVAGVALVAQVAADLRASRNADSLLLALWIAGTVVFAMRLNWTTNGRSVLPLVPAAAIATVRWLEVVGWPRARWLGVGVGVSTVLSLLVCWADCSHARAERSAADTLLQMARTENCGLVYCTQWGMQYYLQAGGRFPIDERRDQLHDGDLYVIPRVFADHALKTPGSEDVGVLLFPPAPLGSTMDPRTGAGFYATWPLPFSFARSEDFLYLVRRLRPPPEKSG